MPRLSFAKVEGLGNDFLLLDRLDRSPEQVQAEVTRLRELAPHLCNRRTGVGGDGILVVAPPTNEGNAATMIVINFDGSRPEMCGNGVRCVAQMVADRLGSDHVLIDTDAGVRDCRVLSGDAVDALVSVGMGPAQHLGETTLESAESRSFRNVSMGNPHAIHFVGADEDPEALARSLGPKVEVDPSYPDRTNVEFCRKDGEELTLWVWERGCGITGACGTGACATGAAAVAAGLAQPDTELRVRLPGGVLGIRVPSDPTTDLVMTGPARVAFVGEIET